MRGAGRGALLPALLMVGVAMAQTAQDSVVKPEPAKVKAAGYPLKSPAKAVLLSLLVPGGGQVYTGNWWKAAIIAPVEVGLGYFTFRAHKDASAALGRGDTAAYPMYRNRRTSLLWFTGASVALSMADAYVSAQMYGFDREMQFALGPGRVGVQFGI